MSHALQEFSDDPGQGSARGSQLRVTSGVRSLGWMSHGACLRVDPELFFPIATARGPAARQVEAAKSVCGHCAVRPDCLSYALAVMPEGIWGGTTLDERRAARRRPSRHQPNRTAR
jgi:WhiB family redox-sensing transcriptional regulator